MHAQKQVCSGLPYQLWAPAPPLGTRLSPPLLLSGLSGRGTEDGAAAAGVCGLCLYLAPRSMVLVGTVSELRGASVLLMSLIADIITSFACFVWRPRLHAAVPKILSFQMIQNGPKMDPQPGDPTPPPRWTVPITLCKYEQCAFTTRAEQPCSGLPAPVEPGCQWSSTRPGL